MRPRAAPSPSSSQASPAVRETGPRGPFLFCKICLPRGTTRREAAMIPMSAEEIKQFWHGFCERQRIKPDMRAEGDKRIEQDPEFWADQTMWQLVEALGGKSPERRDQ